MRHHIIQREVIVGSSKTNIRLAVFVDVPSPIKIKFPFAVIGGCVELMLAKTWSRRQ